MMPNSWYVNGFISNLRCQWNCTLTDDLFHQPENSKKFQALFFYVAKKQMLLTEATGKTITGYGDLQNGSVNFVKLMGTGTTEYADSGLIFLYGFQSP